MGFIQTSDAPEEFPESRMVRPRPCCLDGVWYFRAAEMADLLDIRLSGGFMAALRGHAEHGDLRSGTEAARLRDGQDTARTVFVSAECVLYALRSGGRWAARCPEMRVARIADALGRYVSANHSQTEGDA